MFFSNFIYTCSHSPIKIKDIIGFVWRPWCISLIIYIVIVNERVFMIDFNKLLMVLFSAIISIIVFILLILICPKAKAETI